jgi:hypothetical protein
MARRTTIAAEVVNLQAGVLANLLDGGYLRIYGGTRPATPDDPVTDQTLLAELRFSAPAAATIEDGVVTFAPLQEEPSAPASGTARWFRCVSADGVTPVYDGNVGTADADIILSSAGVQAGAAVQMTALSHVVPQS